MQQKNDLGTPPAGVEVDMTAMYIVQQNTGVIGISKGGVHPCICPFAAIEYRQDESPASNLISANDVVKNTPKYADKPYRLHCSSLCPHFELLNMQLFDHNKNPIMDDTNKPKYQLTVRLSCGGVPRSYPIAEPATK